ncbi:MAG TPA: SRPBCC family protein [Dermatophilaceae bacterium]|nr:SRPBCC family protein [Dermatophilaceae bacterium]
MRIVVWTRRALALLLLYGLGYRPWQLRWGATASEVAQELPGDEIVPHAQWEATRAIDIGARPEEVWPWLVQMGASPRAGWYSYDWADNGGIRSAERIVPELQHLQVGDRLPMTAGSADGFTVEAIDEGRSLVLASRHRDGIVTATFVVRAVAPAHSRLVHRVRFRVRGTPGGVGFASMMDLSDFVMSRRTLLGLRQRAERLAHRRRGGAEPTDHSPGTRLVFDLSVPVRRTARDVHALLADIQDLEPLPRAAGVRMTKSPAGPTRVGTRWHEQVRLVPGLWMRIESTVTAADPPALLGMDFSSVWFTGHLDYRIEPTPGGCLLRQQESLALRGPFTAAEGTVDARLRARLLDRLADIRDVAEARAS